MHFYNLFNLASNILQGIKLDFCADNDAQAVELGKDYAKKLGWTSYSIYFYCDDYADSGEEICLYTTK